MNRLLEVWSQVWPNLLADALSAAVVWAKVHAAHKHVLRLHERLDALHARLGESVSPSPQHPTPKESP